MTARFTAPVLILLAALAAGPAAAATYEKVPVSDPVLDRNGDGYQDVIVERRKVHYDADFDGKFDYTLVLKFSEYTTEGHGRYVASGFDSSLFAALTAEGLDRLCATDREKARWIEKNYAEYPFYRDGYAFLYLFSESAVNDGRLVSPKEQGEYDLTVVFNPDGSVRTVSRGDVTVTVAEFDYGTNTNDGEKIFLPQIDGAAQLGEVRSVLEGLLAGRAAP